MMAAGQVGTESSAGGWEVNGWRGNGWKIWGQAGVEGMKLGSLPVRLPLSLMGNWLHRRLRAH